MPTGITGSQKALMFAQAGVMRAGASRAGYTSPKVFVAINGVQYATARLTDANKVLDTTLALEDVLNETPNTCGFTMQGAEPAEGSDVVITLGSINNLDRTFAGTILNRTHAYVGTPANWHAPINVIDYTWQLTRRRVSGMFTNASVATVAAAIVAHVPGFTLSVGAGFPTLDTFSYTDIDALSALTRLAKRGGGYCDVDYLKVVKLFIADTSVTNPVALTAAHVSLTEFAFTRDLSQVRTRVYVEGGGVTASALCAAGETILPVETTAWYNPLGGTIKSGAQHVIYTGLATGGGSLVGPGVLPSVAPVAVAAVGAGLTAGVYQYAYTDVTAAGESLPSPLGSVTVGGTLAPPTNTNLYSGAGGTGGSVGGGGQTTGYYGYAATFVTGAGETIAGPVTVIHDIAGLGLVLNGVDVGPSGVTKRNLYRTVVQATSAAASAAQLKFLGAINDNTGYSYTDLAADAALGANVPVVNTAGSALQVSLSGIALGPATVTSRKVYRTVVGGTQLKLQQTIANNTATVGVTDATADGSLGANVPTGDTSGLTQPTGQVNPGATSLVLAGAAGGSAVGGWVVLGNGTLIVRYTGITGNTLTGIPASGPGSITVAVTYNSTATFAAALTGIPATGTGAITAPILPGDPVNLLVQVDDFAAQAALATLLGGTDDGVVEDTIQDGTIGETEARARGQAFLASCSTVLVSIIYKSRDPNTRSGRTISVNLGAPTNLVADFQIQHVTVDTFQPALAPTYRVEASSARFSLEDLLRVFRQQVA